jgi:hypothetical protein
MVTTQTTRGKKQDRRKTAKNVLPATKVNVAKWKKNPGRIDIQGVDTKRTTKVGNATSKKTTTRTAKKTNAKPVDMVRMRTYSTPHSYTLKYLEYNYYIVLPTSVDVLTNKLFIIRTKLPPPLVSTSFLNSPVLNNGIRFVH